MIPIFHQIKQWFKTLDPVYLPAIIIIFTFIGSFLLSDFSSITLAILCFCTVLMTIFIYLTKSQKLSKDLLPEGQLSVPSFVILPSGEIKSSNKLGIDFTVQANGQLKNLLMNDGFDEGACYRLLNVIPEETFIEKSYPITYKSRLLENNLV